ncbi:MAG: SwmB domain-containing protein, partial [Prochlorococcus sp.]
IKVDSRSIAIEDLTVEASSGLLSLELESQVMLGQEVSLAYTDLKGDQKAGVIEGETGIDVESFSAAVENLTQDQSPPVLDSATVDGDALSLYFDEELAETAPSVNRFKIEEEGRFVKVTDANMSSADGLVSLTLEKAIGPGSEVIITYKDLKKDQKKGVIQDRNGNDLASFESQVVDNQTSGLFGPLLPFYAEIEGDLLVIGFDREIDSESPSVKSFRALVNNKSLKIKSLELNQDDSELLIRTSKAVEYGDTVVLTYRDKRGDQKRRVLQDLEGNDLESFNGFDVVNNSQKAADMLLESAILEQRAITLAFDQPLGSTPPAKSRFKVEVDGKKQKIISVKSTPDEGLVTVNLKKQVPSALDVLISYKDLKGNQRSKVIEDQDGNDLPSFDDIPVEKMEIDDRPPKLLEASITGEQLTLEFDEIINPGSIKSSRFKVTANKKKLKVLNVEVPSDDTLVVLDVKPSSFITPAAELFFSYKDPKRDQNSGVVQDKAGNDLLTIKNYTIENML